MNFDLDEDQRLLKAGIERFVADVYAGSIERRLAMQAQSQGFDPAGWRQLADLGLLALPFGESDGGLGGGAIELITAAEALGAGLAVEPWLDVVVLAGGVLAAAGTAAQRAAWLPGIMAGTQRLALAHSEAAARHELDRVFATATRSGSGFVLDGGKLAVLHGPGADGFIVSALLDGAMALFLVPAAAPGLAARQWRLVDGSPALDLAFTRLALPAAALLDGGWDALAPVLDRARLAAAAEMLGLMGLLLATTLDYARTRKQFGVPIGSFQVLQHRLVDAHASVEQARSMVIRAALAPNMRQIAGAKAFVAEAALAVGHSAIQVHGGMGMTNELNVGHAHKRIMLLAQWLGDASAARRQFRAAA
jgi:alkylation response protein AidB-like acyl-CoA dehydrogenase